MSKTFTKEYIENSVLRTVAVTATSNIDMAVVLLRPQIKHFINSIEFVK